MLPTEAALRNHKQLPIDDYLVRLRTTSIHNIKYAESVDVLLNLLDVEETNHYT